MSRPENESAGSRRAAGRALASGCAAGSHAVTSGVACLLGVLACLPSEDLSSYSSSYRRTEPELVLEGSVSAPAEPPAASVPASGGEAALGTEAPSSSAALEGECNGDCPAADLPLLSDAGTSAPAAGDTTGAEPAEQSGGTVAPNDVPASESDAGAAPPLVDAAPPTPCGPGALLAPDARCFALISTPSSWSDAREACGDLGDGWDLAVVRSAERNDWLAGMLAGVTDAWVGANDLAQEGSWRWVGDNNPFFTGTGTAGSAAAGAYVNWNTGGTPEPNGGAASDCLRLRSSGGWADIACASTFAALCEGPQP